MRALLTIITFSIMSLMLMGQAPQKMSYQAVVRNNAGELIRNQVVGVRISVLQGAVDGTEIFKEVFNPNPQTNANGLVTVEIGTGAPLTGSFANIKWANGPYFIKTEVDPMGGTNYSIVGTSQLLSVPYALHAKTAESIVQPIVENDPLFTQSPAASITTDHIENWDEAHTWGNHADIGYLTEETQTLEHVLIMGNDGGEVQIKNIADPTDSQDAVTKKYSDAMNDESKAYADQLWTNYEGLYFGEMKYWDGNMWAAVEQGQQDQTLRLCDGVPTWGSCIPIVSTTGITVITDESATGGGGVLNDRGFPVTSRGVVWSTNQNPTVSSNQGMTTNGSGLGVFISNMTGLNPSTAYYVRAYATNMGGTAYGNQVEFNTLEPVHTTITDVEGTIYRTVVIGNQEWMAENLKTSKYRDGANIPTGLSNSSWGSTTSGAYAVYPHTSVGGINSEEEMVATFGRLYNFYAVVDSRGICPTGWRVPTDNDWKILEGTVDGQYGVGNSVWNNTGWRGFDVGKKLRSAAFGNGTDDYGFSATRGGNRENNGGYTGIPGTGFWWTSTSSSSTHALLRYMIYDFNGIYRTSFSKRSGYSVRCVRDVK